MANRYDTTQPVATQLRAVRDDYLMATPDKTDTAYAVLSRAAETIDDLRSQLEDAVDLIVRVTSARWSEWESSEAETVDDYRKSIAKAQGGS